MRWRTVSSMVVTRNIWTGSNVQIHSMNSKFLVPLPMKSYVSQMFSEIV